MKKHGNCPRNGKRSKEYIAWTHMTQRCTNPKDASYKYYGGRGITICKSWTGINGFSNFLADMGLAPTKNHSLDRFPDKNGNYKKNNCRWATQIQQQRNRTNNTLIEYDGQVKTVAEWCDKLNLNSNSSKIYDRLRKGIPFNLAISDLSFQIKGEYAYNAVFSNRQRSEIYNLFTLGVSKAAITKMYGSKWSTIHSVIKKFTTEAEK